MTHLPWKRFRWEASTTFLEIVAMNTFVRETQGSLSRIPIRNQHPTSSGDEGAKETQHKFGVEEKGKGSASKPPPPKANKPQAWTPRKCIVKV